MRLRWELLMTPVDFAAIESRLEEAFGPWWRDVDVRASASDVRALLAAVRERDNTIARVRAELASFEKGWIPGRPNTVAAYLLIADLRAALDLQETE